MLFSVRLFAHSDYGGFSNENRNRNKPGRQGYKHTCSVRRRGRSGSGKRGGGRRRPSLSNHHHHHYCRRSNKSVCVVEVCLFVYFLIQPYYIRHVRVHPTNQPTNQAVWSWLVGLVVRLAGLEVSNLVDDLARALQQRQHFQCVAPPRRNVFRLSQQVIEQLLAVAGRKQVAW